MKRTLEFKKGIIDGETMRDVIDIFPQLEIQFTQRKSFDEYYFEPSQIELTIETIQKLNDLYFDVSIGSDSVELIL